MCPQGQRNGHPGEVGDPVSVPGVRGASSHIRTLNKSHGFSGARRQGMGFPQAARSGLCGKVSGFSRVSRSEDRPLLL